MAPTLLSFDPEARYMANHIMTVRPFGSIVALGPFLTRTKKVYIRACVSEDASDILRPPIPVCFPLDSTGCETQEGGIMAGPSEIGIHHDKCSFEPCLKYVIL